MLTEMTLDENRSEDVTDGSRWVKKFPLSSMLFCFLPVFFLSFSQFLTVNRNRTYKRRKVNRVGSISDPNHALMQVAYPGQPSALFPHTAITPLLSHEVSFQKSNVLPQLLAAWSKSCLCPSKLSLSLILSTLYKGIKHNPKS